MTNSEILRCDGCGQAASPEHVARRLQRLEWATRYRPIHIGMLVLGAAAPQRDSEFLYASGSRFDGEARLILEAAGITADGKTGADALAEFQRRGFFLAHALECPLDVNASASDKQRLLEEHLPSLMARIRRSLKPKRLVTISRLLDAFLRRLNSDEIRCPMVLDSGQSFALDGERPAEAVARLREALSIAIAAR